MNLPGKTLFVATLAAALLGGCGGGEQLDRQFGKRSGVNGAPSVNGTAVLAKMFEKAGHKVTVAKRLSPRLRQCKVLVWAPDDFDPPTLAEREWLEEWLSSGVGRTLVYIGRDFDAGPLYWKKVQPGAPPEKAAEIARRLAKDQADHDQRRGELPLDGYARWFKIDRDGRKRKVETLDGPWAEGVDPRAVDIQLEARLQIPDAADLAKNQKSVPRKPKAKSRSKSAGQFAELPDDMIEEPDYLPQFEPLLTSGLDRLVIRVTEDAWSDGQLLVVVNGSFLLNLPLVNREHRRLADRLIEACGDPDQVAFLESGPGPLPIHQEEPDKTPPTGLALFTIWPLNVVLFHLLALGVVACGALYPIFGRPKSLPSEATSDFGSHIEALGDLLARTRDSAYAHERLAAWRQKSDK